MEVSAGDKVMGATAQGEWVGLGVELFVEASAGNKVAVVGGSGSG